MPQLHLIRGVVFRCASFLHVSVCLEFLPSDLDIIYLLYKDANWDHLNNLVLLTAVKGPSAFVVDRDKVNCTRLPRVNQNIH